jgi:hypothetical protein
MYSIYLAYTHLKLSGKFWYLSRYGMAIVYTKYKPGINLVYTSFIPGIPVGSRWSPPCTRLHALRTHWQAPGPAVARIITVRATVRGLLITCYRTPVRVSRRQTLPVQAADPAACAPLPEQRPRPAVRATKARDLAWPGPRRAGRGFAGELEGSGPPGPGFARRTRLALTLPRAGPVPKCRRNARSTVQPPAPAVLLANLMGAGRQGNMHCISVHMLQQRQP